MAGLRDHTVDLGTFVESTWNQNRPSSTRPEALIRDFEAAAVLDHVSFGAAADAIRKHLKAHLQAYAETISQERFRATALNPQKWIVSTTSAEMEDAINRSRAILRIETDASEGITIPYSEETWQRAIGLLREMADLYWQATGEYLSAPAIGPAFEGSVDLFWEFSDLTLLINVPADQSRDITFFGRRLRNSKISGVLDRRDHQPRHLTGWLSGRD